MLRVRVFRKEKSIGFSPQYTSGLYMRTTRKYANEPQNKASVAIISRRDNDTRPWRRHMSAPTTASPTAIALSAPCVKRAAPTLTSSHDT